jgi:CheY-like chemotaxis protein
MTTLLTTLLEMEKFKVIPLINTSKENITKSLQIQKPHVIIMDIHLHESNGLEILSYIKEDPFLKEIKVILTSGEYLEFESLAAGADYFLLKPYMPKNLLKLLSKLTNEKEGE